ncbi:MAG: hypothetical protein HOV81_11630 [Kofleriaceae bacterium]|nr:hypothetical protein [Kofleriaceae bacterium]
MHRDESCDARVHLRRRIENGLIADPAFIAGKDELRQTLERIRTLLAQAN